MDRKKN